MVKKTRIFNKGKRFFKVVKLGYTSLKILKNGCTYFPQHLKMAQNSKLAEHLLANSTPYCSVSSVLSGKAKK